MRVAQIWAGAHRGALFLPRIGDEVLVQYEEGDPDRPIVVGSVYNGTNEVVAKLPAKKTHSGILTRSSKNSSGYNMLLFDDTVGEERVKLRAQKALMFKSLGDETRNIGGSQTETVGGDETITVGGPTGGGNFTLNAAKSITLNVGEDGLFAQIVMNMEGITLSAMGGLSSIMIQPTGVTIQAPTITALGLATVDVTAAAVNVAAVLNTPMLNAAAATISGIPL